MNPPLLIKDIGNSDPSGSCNESDIRLINQYQWLDNGYTPVVTGNLFYTKERLYIRFKVYEDQPTARYSRLNDPVYQDSCVEFFVQPMPDTDSHYLNFECNSNGVFLLEIGEERHNRTRIHAEPELFQIQISVGNVDPETSQVYWQLSYSFPFEWLQTLFPNFRAEPGKVIRGNFYKCGDKTPIPHFGTWNPVLSETPDYHRSSDFGLLVFE